MTLKSKQSAAIVIALAMFATGCATPAREPESNLLKSCIAKQAGAVEYSGVASVSRPSGTVDYATGLMSGPGSAAISQTAQFNLGSASKMFTAVSVAQLVDAKKVKLDDTITLYVDGLSPEAANVTIRHLLTHSSGYGNFFTPGNLAAVQAAKGLSDLKALIATEKPAFTPGTKFQYSNSGFLLLGLMIERVSGETYGDYLKKHIFAPARMTHSSLLPADTSKRAIGMTTMPELPSRPAGGMNGPVPGAPPPGAPNGAIASKMPPPGPLRPAAEAALMGHAAGSAYSTAEDMHRFFENLLAGKLTSISMRDQLMSPQIETSPAHGGMPARSYGFGFGVGSEGGRRWAGHNGGSLGMNVELKTFPDDQTTIIVLSNRDPPGAQMLMRKLEPAVLEGTDCETPSE